MLKKAIILFTMLGMFTLHAQQLPQFSQYMFNDYLINPAITGTYDYYQIRSLNRLQWAGITDAPQTHSLSVYGPMVSKDMGLGGYVYSDITGPTSRLGVYGSYAYNLGITDQIRLSMGLSLGVLQAKYDIAKAGIHEPEHEGKVYAEWTPDASLGLYLHSPDFFVGFAAHQLLSNKLGFSLFSSEDPNKEVTGFNVLKQHYFLTAGYTYILNSDFAIEPLVIVKAVYPTALQMDLGAKVTYQRTIWGGLSYRTRDALTIILGYNHDNKLYFGYSYDLSLTPIRKYNSGTHEIMIGARFNKIKK